jgi:hypothetical protein
MSSELMPFNLNKSTTFLNLNTTTKNSILYDQDENNNMPYIFSNSNDEICNNNSYIVEEAVNSNKIQKCKETDFQFLGNLVPNKNSEKLFYYNINQGKRRILLDKTFASKNLNICGEFLKIEAITSIQSKVFQSKSLVIRSWIKFLLITGLYIFIWLYSSVIILRIYQSYGNNFFKICVMPLISMIFIQMVVVANIMIFLSSVLSFYWGNFFYSMNKFSILKFIFSLLVPLLVQNHHKAILMYRNIIKAY